MVRFINHLPSKNNKGVMRMTIIGFNFRKILAERGQTNVSKINIANNVAVKKVEEADIPVGSKKQKALRFTY
jgi:hypothetical protein